MLRVRRPTIVAICLLLLLGWSQAASADPPPGYYATVDTSSPAAFAVTLHEVIDDHTRFPYTSSATDTWDILELAQEAPGDPSAILDVYRNESYPKQGGGNSFYQREHIWPQSFGIPDDGSDNYPYTDTPYAPPGRRVIQWVPREQAVRGLRRDLRVTRDGGE